MCVFLCRCPEHRSCHGRSQCMQRVKGTPVQTLRLCTGRTAHRGSRGIVLLFHDHGTRRGWGVSVTLRPLFTPGKDPVPVVQEAGWAAGPVWTGAENLDPHRDSIPGPSSPWCSRYTDCATRPTAYADLCDRTAILGAAINDKLCIWLLIAA